VSYIDWENIHLASNAQLQAQIDNHAATFVDAWPDLKHDFEGVTRALAIVDELQDLLDEARNRHPSAPCRNQFMGETTGPEFDAHAMVTRMIRAQETAFSRASHLDVY